MVTAPHKMLELERCQITEVSLYVHTYVHIMHAYVSCA